MIADLHCHYPMHLLPGDRHPHGPSAGWLRRMRGEFEADAEGMLARVLNNPGWGARWRVDLDGLEQGGVGIVCSVLYWPPAEFDFDRSYGSAPEPGYFDDIKHQLLRVEEDLRKLDPRGERHLVAKQVADLQDEQRVVFVHCIEGGFHLGPDEDAIDANVRWLAEHGVAYITLAHLFFRGVATNAPAIPALSDAEYNSVFHQDPGVGLTSLGKAAVRAMYRHKVLVDVSHMRQDALDDTFALIEKLDRDSQADPHDFPVIATHVGMRAAGPDAQTYNLSADTATRIQRRGGLIGLIMAQHQLGPTHDVAESRAALHRHIEAIVALGNGHASTAIGTDLDGFIKPTLAALEMASDLPLLEGWIREDYPNDADAILLGNVRRVLQQALAARS
jgi:microsomal dipeptidase-like Zn-dependent dipeptidase